MASPPEQEKIDPTEPSVDLVTGEAIAPVSDVDGALTAGPEDELRGPIRQALQADVDPATVNQVITQEREKLARQEQTKKHLVNTINRILRDHNKTQSSPELIVSQLEFELEKHFSNKQVRLLVADRNTSMGFRQEDLEPEIETVLAKRDYQSFQLTFRVTILTNEIVVRPVLKPNKPNQTSSDVGASGEARENDWRAFRR